MTNDMKSRIDLANEDWNQQKRFYSDSIEIAMIARSAFLRGYDSRNEEVNELAKSRNLAYQFGNRAFALVEEENKALKKQVDALIKLCGEFQEAAAKAKGVKPESEQGKHPDLDNEGHVSFDMAKQLKEAGFPQQTPMIGQVWMDMYGLPFVILRPSGVHSPGGDYYFAYLDSGAKYSDAKIPRGSVFAPTAQDIQKEFQKRFGGNLAISCSKSMDLWVAQEAAETLITDRGFYVLVSDPNAANAAARCFLSNPRKRGT